jgi:hypothetical protein
MSKEMCKLVKNEFHTKKTRQFVKLVDKPKFFCKNCGRVAKKKANLCKPVDLD